MIQLQVISPFHFCQFSSKIFASVILSTERTCIVIPILSACIKESRKFTSPGRNERKYQLDAHSLS